MPERLLVPLLHGGSVDRFYHFLLGYLYPISRWLEGREPHTIGVCGSGPMDPWFALLPEEHRVEIVRATEMLQLHLRGVNDPVVLPSYDNVSTFERDPLLAFAERIRARSGATGPVEPGRVTVLDRRRVDPHYRGRNGPLRRSVPNMDEVVERLGRIAPTDHVDASELAPAEQVRTLAASRVLVAQHGAGLTNMLWMPRGSIVVEILPPRGRISPLFGRLAVELGHHYDVVLQDDRHAPVDAAVVAATVAAALEPGAVPSGPVYHPKDGLGTWTPGPRTASTGPPPSGRRAAVTAPRRVVAELRAHRRERSARRRAGAEALRALEDALAPGTWVPAGAELWRRLGSPVPAHLRAQRGGRDGWRAGAARLRARTAPFGRARLVGWARLLSGVAVRPWAVRIRRWSVPADAPVVVRPAGFTSAMPMARHGREGVLLLDAAGGRVARFLPDRVADEYFDLRARFSAHVPTAAVLERGPDWFVEELLEGRPLASLRDGELDAAVRAAFAAATALATAEARPGPAERDRATIALLEGHRPAGWMARLAHDRPLVDLLAGSPIVPAHRDYGAHNLLVVDGRPVCFDLDPRVSGPGPFWLDVAGLVHPRAELPHRRWFREGRYDAEVAALCRAAGWSGGSSDAAPEVLRDLFSALRVVMRAGHRLAFLPERPTDPQATFDALVATCGREFGLDEPRS